MRCPLGYGTHELAGTVARVDRAKSVARNPVQAYTYKVAQSRKRAWNVVRNETNSFSAVKRVVKSDSPRTLCLVNLVVDKLLPIHLACSMLPVAGTCDTLALQMDFDKWMIYIKKAKMIVTEWTRQLCRVYCLLINPRLKPLGSIEMIHYL